MAESKEKAVDWSRFGLDSQERKTEQNSNITEDGGSESYPGNPNVKELFDEDQSEHKAQQPWWKANFFIREPILFGTWDGVFTSCVLNIFGVVIFLRTGWMVGNAGVGLSLLIVVITLLVALVSVLSAIGVCERCHVGNGGVYFLLSHVLGQRAGGAIGLVYSFGQWRHRIVKKVVDSRDKVEWIRNLFDDEMAAVVAVSISLFCAGLGESLAQSAHWDAAWAVRVIGLVTAAAMLLVVLAGVKWVVKLQLLLLAIILLSVLDFVIGTFAHTDQAAGFTGYRTDNMEKNAAPAFSDGQNFFTVFGVFFPSATGVLSGISMSGDLKDPSTNIPAGSLAALGFSGMLYIVFAVLLGAVCTREALTTDYMIASKVALVGVLFLFGLYVSSLSSCLGAQYGAPRVLQVIGQENVIPFLKTLGKERGPNKEPYIASIFVAVIAMLFILVGNLNALAPIVTMPFLITYAAVDYAYFKLAMSYDIQQQRKLLDLTHRHEKHSTTKLRDDEKFAKQNYGTGKEDFGNTGATQECTEKDDSMERENNDKDKENGEVPNEQKKEMKVDMIGDTLKDEMDGDGVLRPTNFNVSDTTSLLEKEDKKDKEQPSKGSKEKELKKAYSEEQQIEWEIVKQPSSYYSDLCNRWVSLTGVFISILIMFLINWGYALANISLTLIVYIYIGQANPSLSKGIASDFNFLRWTQSLWDRITRKKPVEQQIVITQPSGIPYGVATYQVTEDNTDFANRDRVHQSSVITSLAP